MMEKQVITYDGSKYLKSECRYIANKYYKIGDSTIKNSGQCYLINGKYWRDNTGKIEYDHYLRKYNIKNNEMINGIVDYINNDFVFGWFSRNINIVKIYIDGAFITCLNDKIASKNKNYREKLDEGVYYHINDIKAKDFNTIRLPKKSIKNSLPYDCNNIINNYITDYNKYYNNEISYNINKYKYLIENLSFGIEFETTHGIIPNRFSKKLGLIPLRDGSISGLEYVTIPLSGGKGIQTIIDICKVLKDRTLFNESCSIHLHIGGIPRTMSFLLALYRVLSIVEDDIYDMFPIYKKKNYNIKRKNYTQPLPSNDLNLKMDYSINDTNIEKNFEILYNYLSMGSSFINNYKTLEDVKSHPSDPRGNSKWQIKTRYCWTNMIPLLFGNKKTVEFRIHTATFDYNKIINFLYICSSIINFTIENEKMILKDPFKLFKNNNKLTEILYHTIYKKGSHRLFDKLLDYINSRKRFIGTRVNKGDIVADESKFNYYSNFDWNNNKYTKTISYNSTDIRDIAIRLNNEVIRQNEEFINF